MHRRALLWLVPIAFALHNLEELLLFSRYLPLVLARMPTSLRSQMGWTDAAEVEPFLQLGLVLATVIPIGAVAWATLRPKSRLALGLVLVLTVGLLLNVLWHVVVGLVLFGGYTPGLVTALLVNLPLTLYILYRAMTEHWLRKRLS